MTGLTSLKNKLSDTNEFGFDFETTTDSPLDKLFIDRGLVVGLSFSWKPGEACYLPINHVNYSNNWDEEVILDLEPFFQDDKKIKIAHNVDMEEHCLRHVGTGLLPPVFDTMLAINLIKDVYNYPLSLKEFVYLIFNYQMRTFEEVTNGKCFSEVGINDETIDYTCADSDFALQSFYFLMEKLKETDVNFIELCRDIDSILALSLVEMERNGCFVDVEKIEQLDKQVALTLESSRAQFEEKVKKKLKIPPNQELTVPVEKRKGKTREYEIVEVPFNINSTDHLGWLLFNAFGLSVISKSKKARKPQTGGDIIKKLKSKYPQLDIFDPLIKYKKYQKIYSTYVKGYKEHIKEDNRIHSNIDQVFVRTSRFSSTAPNLMNTPRPEDDPIGIRNIFIAPPKNKSLTGEDSLLLLCDYSQIELRILAWMAQEESMINAFLTGKDIHSQTAWEVFDLQSKMTVAEVKKKDPESRFKAKAVNFGIGYGLSDHGLAERLLLNDLENNKPVKSQDDYVRTAQSILKLHNQKYPQIKHFQISQINKCRQVGYVETMFGRRRYIPDINSHRKFKRQYAERQCMNTPIQGSASEIIKRAMVNIYTSMPKKLYLLLQIHDELKFEAPVSRIRDYANFIKETMEIPIPGFDLPIEAEVGIANQWGNKIEYDLQKNSLTVKEKDEVLINKLERAGINIES